MNQQHATALKNKHKLLSKQIEFEQSRSAVNHGLLMSLKRERLKIKDSLSSLNVDDTIMVANS